MKHLNLTELEIPMDFVCMLMIFCLLAFVFCIDDSTCLLIRK